MRSLLIAAIVVCVAASAYGLEKQAVQMREDFGTQPLYDCYMNYYYFIPGPSSSWFWMLTDHPHGEVIGEWFQIGDPSMGRAGAGCPPYLNCDPCGAHVLEQFRILDFAGYSSYPGRNYFAVEFNIWCADASGCPVGPSLWSSGPLEFNVAGWNYVQVKPPLCLTACATELEGSLKCRPRFLITATHVGTTTYNQPWPAWGLDNISTPVILGCTMHDTGCCPALYPRPQVSHYDAVHSGNYGINFSNCPPQRFLDSGDSVGNVYGCVELAWKVYLKNIYSATEPSTWGNIKSIYK
jgi:hypothetical protein